MGHKEPQPSPHEYKPGGMSSPAAPPVGATRPAYDFSLARHIFTALRAKEKEFDAVANDMRSSRQQMDIFKQSALAWSQAAALARKVVIDATGVDMESK
jgi:hypothetical protein